MHRESTAAHLVLNGALLILARYLCGAAIPHVPYPRIMLAAHSAWVLLAWGMRRGAGEPAAEVVATLASNRGAA
jgi:hypothetical protein